MDLDWLEERLAFSYRSGLALVLHQESFCVNCEIGGFKLLDVT